MAEHSFQEVMRQFDRMCKANAGCFNCPLNEPDGVSDRCSIGAFVNNSERIEREVMSWAAEHPEPVYPMWCEWLADKGVVDVARMPVDYSGGIITEIKPSGKMYEHIPADIAQKLGIEPKEGI
jgi:hypothetical protein